MTDNTKKLLISCAVIIIIAGMCIFICAASLIAFVQIADSEIFQETTTREPLAITPVILEADENDPNPIPEEALQQMALIEAQMISLRGLDPNNDIIRILYSPEQLRKKVTEDFFGDYTAEEAALDVTVLSVFGLLEPSDDILDIYIELYSEGIAGFYDDETGEMVVVNSGNFTGVEHITYAHEYIHALQDFAYDLDDGLGYSEETCEEDSELCLALQALIEGDASFSELSWYLEYATPQQKSEIEDFYVDFKSPAYDSSPAYLQQDLLYPYTYGQQFVSYLFNLGGWDSVNNAYAAPPVSTEQILHPERYPTDIPIEVILPNFQSLFGAEWELLEEDTLGEWYTLLMLGYGANSSTRLNEFRSTNAAEGWGGDAYAIYQNINSQETALILEQVWDTSADADEYVIAFNQYASARFGNPAEEKSNRNIWETSEAYIIFYFDGNQTIWIVSPSEEISTQLLDSLLNP